MLLLMYSITGSLFKRTVQPAEERSADASDNSKSLFGFEIWQTFDFQDTTGEDVLLVLLFDSE